MRISTARPPDATRLLLAPRPPSADAPELRHPPSPRPPYTSTLQREVETRTAGPRKSLAAHGDCRPKPTKSTDHLSPHWFLLPKLSASELLPWKIEGVLHCFAFAGPLLVGIQSRESTVPTEVEGP